MKYWTVQSNEVIKILLNEGVYKPDFKKSNNYAEMQALVYDMILNTYNEKNDCTVEGLIFGFSFIKQTIPENIKEFYSKFLNDVKLSSAFSFWSDKFSVLEVEVPSEVDIVPIPLYDFIELGMYQQKDTPRVKQWVKDVKREKPYFNLYQDVLRIKNNLEKGKIEQTYCIQIHTPELRIENILGVYPQFDYNTGITFELSESSNKLSEVIKQ